LKPSGSDSAASLRSAESSDSGQGDSASLYEQQQSSSLHHPASAGETPHSSSHLYPSQISLPLFQKELQGSGVCESTAQAETDKSATLPIGLGPKKVRSVVPVESVCIHVHTCVHVAVFRVNRWSQ
jgi:hypothetical protein